MTNRRELPIERLAMDFLVAVDAVAARLPHWRGYLAIQMRRAVLSVYLNLREGIGEFRPREKARFFRMSLRSQRECFGCLKVVMALHPERLEEVSAASGIGRELRPKIVRVTTYQTKRREPE